MVYNVIRWPDAQGPWWLVAETGKDGSYTPLLPLYPKWTNRQLLPTWENQLWTAAELLVNKGLDAVNNPHAMIGRTCGCGDCFCCAALEVYKIARDVIAYRPGHTCEDVANVPCEACNAR
jgi:hypothetical protein